LHVQPLSLHSGFTALDVVVTLAIAALLLLSGVPALRQHTMQQHMKSAISSLHSDLVLARSEAIGRAARIVVCPLSDGGPCAASGEWQQGWRIFHDVNDDRQWQASEPLLRQAQGVEGLLILSSDYRTRLRFFPNGTAPGSNATITFCDGRGPGAAQQITVSASGRIRRKPDAGTVPQECSI